LSRACSVCTHAERDSVDRDLLTGTPNTRIAARIGVSEQAVRRHRELHLPERLAKAQGAAEVASATDLLTELRALRSKAISLLLKAEAAGDFRTALAGIGQARSCLELLGELEGELDRRPQVNLTLSVEWLTLRTTILRALEPFPDAGQAVAAAIATVNGHAGN
jgi:hypothetical protein